VRTIDCGLPTIPTEKYRRNYYINTGAGAAAGGAAQRSTRPVGKPVMQADGVQVADFARQYHKQVNYYIHSGAGGAAQRSSGPAGRTFKQMGSTRIATKYA
jgi:hypothetical protein